jgi:DNA-directed RNA polymerase subunit RPC12/RpoP
MAIRCSECKREFDVTLFEFENTIRCACGNTVTLQHKEVFNQFLQAQRQEDIKIKEIKKLADRISFLIISTDYPDIDIEIEKQKLKDRISELFPEKKDLYELIYEPRFRRLKEQFREP